MAANEDGGTTGGDTVPAAGGAPAVAAGTEADLRAALGATMAKLTEMRAEMKSKQEHTDTQLKEIMEKTLNMNTKKKGPGPNGEEDITASKAFSDLPKNNGKTEVFDNWRFTMANFLGKDGEYTKLLSWIEKNEWRWRSST